MYKAATAQRRTHRRRLSVAGSLASIVPSRHVIDTRLVVSPSYDLPSFDCKVFKLDKDIYFIHESALGAETVIGRISKSSKGLLSGSTWQIFAGKDEPVAVLKQSSRASTLNSTFSIYAGSDAKSGSCVYSVLKKLRSSKLRVYDGDSTKDLSMLNCFCFISPERVHIKTRDGSALGEAAGGTIVDWRQQNSVLRVGKGFDLILAFACFCLADMFESVCPSPPASALQELSESVRNAQRVDFLSTLGWT
jgi:hypothetical protein